MGARRWFAPIPGPPPARRAPALLIGTRSAPDPERVTEIALARAALAAHQLCEESGRCAACGHDCPCEAANDAANALSGHGLPLA